VERDLPKAVEIMRKEGLMTPMITADIVDAKTPHAEAILRTASGLGIHHYRWGGFTYTYERSLADQLEEMKPRVAGLAALNEKYKMSAMYHTHSGLRQVGAPIWDLWYVLKDMDPRWVGINYDIGHATVEGGFGGWIDSARLIGKYMRGVALKDFKWGQNARGAWAPQWCAAGEGQVNFAGFFEILKTQKFSGPVQLHFEYPGLGGADGGRAKLEIPKEKLVAQMRKDLEYVRKLMRQAQLA
jgi:sugar phosphate isomerase/epimerase